MIQQAKNKLKAVQIHSRKATHYEVIKRWKKYVEQFRHHRTLLKTTINDIDFAMKAMDKVFDVGISNFKAILHFMLYFKNKYKITSRRITHLVTK